LSDGAFGEIFVVAEEADGVGEMGICEFVGHGGILHLFGARGQEASEK
jgi:hypothetical protein